ncbi:MAG TPA: chemotaxis protein CheB [Bryobacteraceae bacterium]
MNNPLPATKQATVVGIGASAGGLAALQTFFQSVPEDCGVAFVVVVHLAPEYESHLADLLQPFVGIPVQQVTNDAELLPNNVYVIPPNANLTAIDTHLRLDKLEERRRERAPIDHFFRTMASMHDGHAIGVVLTGTGSDGTLGIKDIKANGGLVIVQDPSEAEYDGMPQSAIATGLVDLILPVAEIASTILKIDRTEPRIELVRDNDEEVNHNERAFLQRVFAHLRTLTDRDFSRYKQSTILRRISRRMQLNYIDNQEEYLRKLRENTDEALALADDFLITVTSFFRDPDVFERIAKEIIPPLFDSKNLTDSLRVWSVGCATGEEAYSLAMLLLEEAGRRETAPQIQIFASDLHRHSLKIAREGFYSGDIETDVSAERLERFFQKESGGYRVRKDVRDMVVFAPHNLLGDPPFSRIDLISCRNVLIYLQRHIQRDVVELFHYALATGGLLVLGPAETIDATDLFRTQDKKLCLYRKRNVRGPEPRLPVFPQVRARRAIGESVPRVEPQTNPVAYGMVHQRMLERFAPPSILVSADNKVVHLSDHAGRYLLHPGGELSTNVFRLVREELRLDLQAALQIAREKKHVSDSKPVAMRFNGSFHPVVMHVRPALDPEIDGYVLIIFEEREPVPTPGATEDGQSGRTAELESALRNSNQRLQGVIEEYETSQEEMKASNEEMQSTNEELRSTMEELETSKEELQSINEELQTVNQENRHKVEELAQLSSDLSNLLVATDIATLFLDRNLRILRFTPKLGEIFNIRQTDRGRPISDLTHHLGYKELRSDAETVLNNLTPLEREVKDEGGRWYLTRVLPYRSTDDRIEGIVITFIDVTTRKDAETALRTLLEGIPQLVWRSADGGDWTWVSPQWSEFTGLSAERSRGTGWLQAIHPADRSRTMEAWKAAGERGMLDVQHRIRREADGAYCWHRTRSVPNKDGNDEVVEWLGTSTDIEDLKRAQAAVKKSEEQFRLFVDQVHDYAMIQTDPQGHIISWNPGAERLFGYLPAEAMGESFATLIGVESEPNAEAEPRKEAFEWLTRKNGKHFWASWISERIYDDGGRLIGIANVVRDDTERKRTEDQLLMLVGELNHRVRNTIATVQSIASQTLRQGGEPSEFVSHFTGRLHALAQAHGLLNRTNWKGADLNEIIEQQLAVLEEADRVSRSGPAVHLDAQSSLALALLLHELGTNARKYGALSVLEARVSIEWRVDDGHLEIDWRERGGPAVTPPKTRGFGLNLIERGLAGVEGSVALEFDPAGLMCKIRIPVLEAAKAG